jgi:hypothetical protein
LALSQGPHHKDKEPAGPSLPYSTFKEQTFNRSLRATIILAQGFMSVKAVKTCCRITLAEIDIFFIIRATASFYTIQVKQSSDKKSSPGKRN